MTVSLSAVICIFAASSVFNFFLQSSFFYVENYYQENEKAILDSRIEEGPFKGVYTNGYTLSRYNSLLKDLKEIKKQSPSGFYVAGNMSWCYLYVDADCSAYSAWFVGADYPGREIDYWSMHEEKAPDCIYVPGLDGRTYSATENVYLARLRPLEEFFDCNVRKSSAGYILTDCRVKSMSEAENA